MTNVGETCSIPGLCLDMLYKNNCENCFCSMVWELFEVA